jgi:hypothetical protein
MEDEMIINCQHPNASGIGKLPCEFTYRDHRIIPIYVSLNVSYYDENAYRRNAVPVLSMIQCAFLTLTENVLAFIYDGIFKQCLLHASREWTCARRIPLKDGSKLMVNKVRQL